ncbi:CDP-glycerol glycerophosphotransferase family protein [Proteus mirabilis]|uniref:CDP-glycerol glycerophosphotransferase family protein n=1 Tax=Proteus mirabilis TaxID=584 RepID=UPI001D828B2B|nr:CDP-glycerol glycerophosphotransferase family protein [Proteus mirabilis]MBS5817914.1 CDP-glycerol glycerophosphotransferase family protein [Proteus mirabilis]MDC9740009.1 CDP-glycerol glycerophosphotransferase family protein [Proteus mirabilis]MDC9746895.1 CDP-glycerol glycerophosphotransferase family protein [Proteus mirabilis]
MKFIHKIILLILSIIYIFIPKNNKKIIFTSYKNMKYNFCSRIFFEFLLQQENEYDIKFVINDNELRDYLNKNIGNYFITSYKFKDVVECLSSRIWISSCKPIYSSPLSLIGHININVWHGIPLKKVGINDKHQSKIKKLIYKYYYSWCFYSLFVVSSEEVKKLIHSSFNVKNNKIFISGSLIGENFSKSIDLEQNNKLKNILIKSRKNKVLYAPTYRDGGKTQFFPFNGLDKNEFEKFLKKNEITIYIRPHHLEKNYKKYIEWEGIEYLGSDIISEITYYLENFNFLITDYSSILFDYMLTNGNLILLPYDYDIYKKERGLNFSIDEINYGDIATTLEDFKNSLLQRNKKNTNKDKIIDRFHSIRKDQCTTLLKKIKIYDK